LETLKKRSDFVNIAKSGLRRPIKSLVLQVAPNELGTIRVGYTITKQTSKLAVERNRIKRRLRAAVREVFPEFAKPSHDYVIIGRIECLRKDFEELKGDLRYALKKVFDAPANKAL
jgi:ribonuclease P protein component